LQIILDGPQSDLLPSYRRRRLSHTRKGKVLVSLIKRIAPEFKSKDQTSEKGERSDFESADGSLTMRQFEISSIRI